MENKDKKNSRGMTRAKPFSFDTIEDFDGHIASSIIGYNNLMKLIIPLASNYITEGSTILDLGCSSGKLLRELSYRYNRAYYLGYDTAVDNLYEEDPEDRVIVEQQDITDPDFAYPSAKLILSIFTMQFLPPEERYKVYRKIKTALQPGGAFILAEKVYCKSGILQDHFQFAHYDLKGLNFSPKEILEKQRDIRTIMKPRTEAEVYHELYSNFSDLIGGGGDNVELFWASYNFRAWIVVV